MSISNAPTWARPVDLMPAGWLATGIAALSCGMLGLWQWGFMAGTGLIEALVCTLPPAVTLALAFTRRDDRRQYLVRLVAAAAMLPLLLSFWVTDGDGRWDAAAIASLVVWVLAYIAGFCAMVFWMAAGTTRIDADVARPAAAAAGRMADALQALRALQGPAHMPRVTVGPEPGRWNLETAQPGGRIHRVELRLDAARGVVRVREVVSADGAAPANADEASMRTIGDAPFDPARPPAQRVWSRQWQATVIEPHRLGDIPFDADALLPAAAALQAANTTDAWMHLLAATALRAGLSWQPTLARV
ncbi:MAG: hypothetical protein ACKVQR_22535 [Aquabacterium sp.]